MSPTRQLDLPDHEAPNELQISALRAAVVHLSETIEDLSNTIRDTTVKNLQEREDMQKRINSLETQQKLTGLKIAFIVAIASSTATFIASLATAIIIHILFQQ